MKLMSHSPVVVFLAIVALSLTSFQRVLAQSEPIAGKIPVPLFTASNAENAPQLTNAPQLETATFGGGCFWCVEAVYQRVDGVKSVVSGYAGGQVPKPTYEAVCTGRTGHAEVCQITFDPSVVSFDEMLLIFFKTHDPTTLNKQGVDVGTQYRSVVFYENEAQREATEKMVAKLIEDKVYRKIVTEISPIPEFFPAEAYHQNYFKLHPKDAYCRNVIDAKVAKFEKLFKENSRIQKERQEKNKLKK